VEDNALSPKVMLTDKQLESRLLAPLMVMNVHAVQIPRTARVIGTVTSQYRACDGEVEAIPGVAKRV
jgi:hypothetical protein